MRELRAALLALRPHPPTCLFAVPKLLLLCCCKRKKKRAQLFQCIVIH
jgi:hypothetical protein